MYRKKLKDKYIFPIQAKINTMGEMTMKFSKAIKPYVYHSSRHRKLEQAATNMNNIVNAERELKIFTQILKMSGSV